MNSELTKNSLSWWEQKRIWYNLVVLLIGVWQIVSEEPETFGFADIKCIIIYGIGANIFYSSGLILELLDEYYFKTFFKFNRFRWLFLILGTLFSIFFVMYAIAIYYNGPIWLW